MMLGIVFHIIVSLLITLRFMRNGSPGVHTLSVFLIAISFPVGGPLLIWFFYTLPINRSEMATDFSAEALINQTSTFGIARKLDFDQEVDVAPMEDALMLADFDKRREVVMNMLKKNAQINSSLINLALHNEDSETAHYAASSILQSKRKLDVSINEVSRVYEKNPSNAVNAIEYVNLLKQYIGQANLDPVSLLMYRHTSIRVLKNIVDNKLDKKGQSIITLIEFLLAIGDYHEAITYCKKLMKEYPDTEEKYIVLLKCFYLIKDKRQFDQILKNFLASDISFSDETMNIVRLWLGAIAYEKN